MKRILFYLLLAGAVIGSSCCILWAGTGYDLLNMVVTSLFNGTLGTLYTALGLNLFIYICGLALFIVLNAALLLTMLLIFLFTGFNLKKIAKFYRIWIWWLVSSVIYTAALVWGPLTNGFTGFHFDFANAWYTLLPIVTALVVMVLAIIFRNIEKKNRF